ncbi:hypothetical protein MMC22_007387 [Lobaria immixta]|nr:hypothetical protein [Lobaria immixta]
MASTADRWFGPESDLSIDDYALVGQSAVSVREDLLETDNAVHRISLDPDATFMTEYDSLNQIPRPDAMARCYDFGVHGRLVYADVDDEDPAHREKINELAKMIPIEGESDRTMEIKKELVSLYSEVGYSQLSQEEREHWTLIDIYLLRGQGILEERIFSHILTAKTIEEKEEFINFMSGQTQSPAKRPVLSLINMIDSKQTTEVGETEGWVTGYDFIKDLLVIKPFVSKGGNHPLGAKWHGNVAQDGVSFSGTPQDFAKAYVGLGKSVDAGNKIDHFGTAFVTVYGKEFYADLFAINEATKKIKKAMEEIKFPVVDKNTKRHGFEFEPFFWMLSMIELEESMIRDTAVDANKRGEEKIARNAAKLYESIHEQIKAFIENPSMDL